MLLFFAALFAWASTSATAGIKLSDTPPAEAQEPTKLEWLDLWRQRVAGLEPPLFAPAPQLEYECDTEHTPTTRGLLIGAGKAFSNYGFTLPGPANDIQLLTSAMVLRGASPSNIIGLSENATYDAVKDAALALVDETSCGDSVVLHFSGGALSPHDLVLDFGTLGQHRLSEFSASQFTIETGAHVLAGGPFVALDPSRPDGQDVLSAAALSELVTILRNKGADVTVSLDVSSSMAFRIEQRQAAIDPLQFRKLKLLGEQACLGRQRDAQGKQLAEPACEPSWSPTNLAPHRGSLTVFYGTPLGNPGREAKFAIKQGGKLAGDEQVYGYASYQLATAITSTDRTTVGALARAIRQEQETLDNPQSHSFVTNAPDLDIIAEGRSELNLQQNEIIIDSPSLDRAGVKLRTPQITISGRIQALGQPLNVVVNGKLAQLEGDSGFRATVPLTAGVNGITIFASTDRNEALRRDFELFYEGDIRGALNAGKRYLVVIANQDYQRGSGITNLQTPVGDGKAIAQIMRDRYGFETTLRLDQETQRDLVLENATYRDIQLLLGDLSYAVDETDTVVIFYAGHGEYSDTTGTGYWLPVDARAGRLVTYLDSKMITDTLQLLPAKNVLVISDSCYSGMLARGGAQLDPVDDADRLRALQRLSDQRSRVVISSGGNEPVADGGGDGHSVFARALINALSGPEGVAFSARELHAKLFNAVTLQTDQSPDVRPIRGAGHDGGDFVFVVTQD
ncbi:caspase family protein [Thalassovita sp.]|uniref:caspase family protein n=1 Tax=Thalassovita sp. TaxID=1979401 RepID=UPI003B5B2D1B